MTEASCINANNFSIVAQQLEPDAETRAMLESFRLRATAKYDFDWVFDWVFLACIYNDEHVLDASVAALLDSHYQGRYHRLKHVLTPSQQAQVPTQRYEFAYHAHACDLMQLAEQLSTLDCLDNTEAERTRKRLIQRLRTQAQCAIDDEIQEDFGDSDGMLMMMAFAFADDFAQQLKYIDCNLIARARQLVENDAGRPLPTDVVFLLLDPCEMVLSDDEQDMIDSRLFVGVAYKEIDTIILNPAQMHRRMVSGGDLFVHELIHMYQDENDVASRENVVDWVLCEGPTETKTLQLLERRRTRSKYRPVLEIYRRFLKHAQAGQELTDELAYNSANRLASAAIALYGSDSEQHMQQTFDWICHTACAHLSRFPGNALAAQGLRMNTYRNKEALA